MKRKSNDRQGEGSTGSALKSYLESHGMSQAELMRRTGLSKETIQRLVHGDRIGTLDTWMRIWMALDCDNPWDVLGVVNRDTIEPGTDNPPETSL